VNVPVRAVLTAAAIALILGLFVLVGRQSPQQLNDYGISPCAPDAAEDLLSTDALQCWFNAPHGRWRTLSHQDAYGALVVQVEAVDLADADEIARRFVANQRHSLQEISVYVQRDSATEPRLIRRIRWTPGAGFETLDFTAPAAR
jgi:hypothetical protein